MKDRKLKQVLPGGRLLPMVIDCVPNNMAGASTAGSHTTSWALVQEAWINPTTDSRRALASLCHAYWQPVYAFIRRNGYDRDRSHDLTQAFFSLLLEGHALFNADRERGKFRSFLLTAVKHFLGNESDQAQRLNRGEGQVSIPIDLVEAERWYAPASVPETSAESLYERRWALSLLQFVLVKLRAEFTRAGKADQFDSLSVFLHRGSEGVRYGDIAEQMGSSAATLRGAVDRMREKYRELLRAEIAETVSRPDQIDEEIRFLLETFSG